MLAGKGCHDGGSDGLEVHANSNTQALCGPFEVPFAASPVIADVDLGAMAKSGSYFTGSNTPEASGDIWPTTWAHDDSTYTAYGDGWGWTGEPKKMTMFARIDGDPSSWRGAEFRDSFPDWYSDYSLLQDNVINLKGLSLLAVDGVIYHFLQVRRHDGVKFQPIGTTLIWTGDYGVTWQNVAPSHTQLEVLFGVDGSFVDGAFHETYALQYGRDYADGPEFVYLYGPENQRQDVMLARVPKGSIPNRHEYEFFSGLDSNCEPLWSASMGDRVPVASWPDGQLANSRVAYNPYLDRFFMTGVHFSGGPNQESRLIILDAPAPWGPWTRAAMVDPWGGSWSNQDPNNPALYAPSFPTKWMQPDGQTMFLVFSGVTGGELGGGPGYVFNVQQVAVSRCSTCAQDCGSCPGPCETAVEGTNLTLACPPGTVITAVLFASYGSPTGDTCGSFSQGNCHASSSQSVVEAMCLGLQSCSIAVDNATFGDPCPGDTKTLAIEVACTAGEDGGGDGGSGGSSASDGSAGNASIGVDGNVVSPSAPTTDGGCGCDVKWRADSGPLSLLLLWLFALCRR